MIMTVYLVYRECKPAKGGRSYLAIDLNPFRHELRLDYSIRGSAHVFTNLDSANEAAREYGGKVEVTEVVVKDETTKFASLYQA